MDLNTRVDARVVANADKTDVWTDGQTNGQTNGSLYLAMRQARQKDSRVVSPGRVHINLQSIK